MPEHAFGDYHGIVYQHSDSEHEAHHRQNIQGQPGEIQRSQSNEQREWYGRSHD